MVEYNQNPAFSLSKSALYTTLWGYNTKLRWFNYVIITFGISRCIVYIEQNCNFCSLRF